MPVPHPTPTTGTVTTDLTLQDRISKTREILIRHGFLMSAVPEISKTFNVSLRTAYRYKAKAEKELKADIDLTDHEAAQVFLEGLLSIFHTEGAKAAVRLRALDLLAKAKGLYRPQKVEITNSLANLPDEELRALEEQLGLSPPATDEAPASTQSLPTESPQPPG
mgnify:CR=1 FL=1